MDIDIDKTEVQQTGVESGAASDAHDLEEENRKLKTHSLNVRICAKLTVC